MTEPYFGELNRENGIVKVWTGETWSTYSASVQNNTYTQSRRLAMAYTITKHIKIEHDEDGWSFDFTADECGTVSVEDGNGPGYQTIHIPKDCIQHFIDVLEQYK